MNKRMRLLGRVAAMAVALLWCMLLEASPVPVDLDTDAEDPALGREMNNLFF